MLDRHNPRLINVDDNTTDEEIIAQLYRAEDLSELLQSISANGYLDIEPLIVLEENERFTVLEGNRRLSAIRLLREPDLSERVAQRAQLRITLPEIPETYRNTLDYVSVYSVPDRDAARSFVGFKHINGAARWESYAKAKFAADWYRSTEISLVEIADRIGDKHDTVKRMVNAVFVLEQAKDTGVFDIENRVSPRFNFSHLYTALSRTSYMQFLSLGSAWTSYNPAPNPVPDERVDQLSEVLTWLYGSKEDSVDPVIKSQNPDVKNLGEVLGNPEGLIVLRATGSLSEAHDSTHPTNVKFFEALIRARYEIREAASNLRGFDGRDTSLVDIAEDVFESATIVRDRVRQKARDLTRGE